MARPINRLSARKVATAGAGYHADGGGLYLLVSPTGSRSWVLRYQLSGRRREMGLGSAALYGLADARQRALQGRRLLADGIDPITARAAAQAATGRTWGQAVEAFIESHRHGWKNDAQADQWRQSLRDHGPDLSLPVAAITTALVLDTLRKIWTTKTETAARVRGRIERIWDAERVAGTVAGDNPARWRGHLDNLLPKPAKVAKVRHFAAMPYADAPAFWQSLGARKGLARDALRFTMLTAARDAAIQAAQDAAGEAGNAADSADSAQGAASAAAGSADTAGAAATTAADKATEAAESAALAEQARIQNNIFDDPIAPTYLKTVSDMLNGDPISAFRFIPPAQHAAIRGQNSTFNTQPGLQAAVDALNDIGSGTLILPVGGFVLNSPIQWRDRVSLIGQGAGASILKMHGDLFSAIRQTGQGSPGGGDPTVVPLTDCMFANFEIDGSGLTNTERNVDGKGLFILYMRRAKFLNLYIHDTIGTGLGCDFLDDTLIHGCVVERAGRNWGQPGSSGGQSGIGIGTGWREVESVTISDCHTIDCGNYGIFVENQIAYNAGTHDPETLPRGARIVNCYARGNLTGMANRGSGATLFMGCDSVENREHGFSLSRGSGGDRIIGCLSERNAGNGITVDTYTGDLLVSGTRVRRNARHGISVSNSSASTIAMRDIYIEGGEVSDNGLRGITISPGGGSLDGYAIRGVTIKNNATALTSGSRQGIAISGDARNGKISDNWFGNRDGSTSQALAVQVYNPATSLHIIGNTVKDQSSAPFTITPASTDVVIRNNPGYNSPGPAGTISVAASPWTYSAPTETDEMVYLEGTGIQVSVGGSVIFSGVANCSFMLTANSEAVITYTTLTHARRMRL